MDPSESPSFPWWRRHGLTALLLSAAAAIAFLVRTLWMIPLVQQFGPANLFGGGSDSFYHFRVAQYIILNHRNLIHDPLLKFPFGAINPREPLFDWMNAVLGTLFAGAFGGNASNAAAFFLELDGPLWAALGIFPVYLIGKEVGDRRIGIVAGLLYALTVASMDSSNFGYANYLSFYTFFILVTIYGYLRTVHFAGTRRWVPSYRRLQEIPGALRSFVRTERSAVKWAVFTGVSFGALTLAWQGFTFVVATIVIFLAFAMIVERIRKIDSFGLYVSTWIVGLVGFAMAAPYYYVQGLILSWYGLPLLVFAGGLFVLLPLVVLRDQPWVVSIPSCAALVAAAAGALYVINKDNFTNIVTGQGYFVKTLVYSTVAEAQAPSIDQLILGYGVLTFFLAFVGLALWVVRMARGRFPRNLMLGVVFAAISIYLPLTAAKFFFLGSAAFALLPSEALIRAIDVADLPKLRRTVAQLSDRRSQVAAFRRGFKARNVLVPVGVVLLLSFNTWYSIDAGIAYNYKGTYSQQIYNSLPSFLQSSPTNASTFYLGAAGVELDTPPQYDEAGYNWLAQQDQNLPPPQRPAFVSWWDYGFQAIAQGDHPSVADNFQNGIVPSGNFLLAQNESLAIGVLTTTLLTAEQQASGQPTLPSGLNDVLAADHVDLATLHLLLTNPTYDKGLVLAHPERYLPVDASHLDGANALYDAVSWELASTRSTNSMAQVYDDVQSYTHWTIRYAMVDNRLFPFSGQDTGIFYAPADLTDRKISTGGQPTTYFTVNITGSDGNTYPYGPLPAGVSAAAYPITYHPAFYNSMIYRIFEGYNATQVNLGSSPSQQIPGVTLQNAPPEPGWMMAHFELAYQTAYYCPYSTPSGHPGCEVAMNLPVAAALQKKTNGSVSASVSQLASSGGEMILTYYPGQPMVGSVRLPDGTPVAGVRVTVSDSFGIAHMVTVTGKQGQYSLILPPGNDTVNVTTGQVNLLTGQGTTKLLSQHIFVPPAFGYALHPATMVRPLVLTPSTVSGIIYWNAAANGSYVPNVDPAARGAVVSLWGQGPVRNTTVDASGAYRFGDLPPGTYNLSVLYRGANYTNTTTNPIFAETGKTNNQSVGLSPASIKGLVRLPSGRPAGAGVAVQLADARGVLQNVTTDPTGNFTFPSAPPGNLTLRASMPSEGLASMLQAVPNVRPSLNVTQNLSLVAFGRVSLTVVASGSPVAGFAVRFLPELPFGSGSANASATGGPPPPGGNASGAGNGTANRTGRAPPTTPVHANGTLLISGPDGVVTGALPVGNYSVYGLGLVQGRWSAGLSQASVGPGVSGLPPLVVSPAGRISGTVPTQNAPVGDHIQVLAFNALGQVAWTFTNDTGRWGLSLPYGSYSVAAVQPASAGYPDAYASVRTVAVTGDSSVGLPMGPAVLFRPLVGASPVLPGPMAPVPGARVQVSIPSSGITLTALANGTGNVTFYVPASLPLGASYCANATAPGYARYTNCGLGPSSLEALRTVALVPNATTLSLRVTGLPPSGTAQVNFTALGGTARSFNRTVGASSQLPLAPGSYRITAWGRAPSGTLGLYQQTAPGNLTVEVGGAAPTASVALVRVVPSNGTLGLAPGVGAGNVSLTLSGGGYVVHLSGTQYRSHFLLPPGSYSVLATAEGPGTYAWVGGVAFNATGHANRTLPVTTRGTSLALALSVPGATLGNGTLAAQLRSGSGWSVPIAFADGRFTGVVEANVSYTVSLSGTSLLTRPATGTSYYANLTTTSGSGSCDPAPPTGNCTIELSAVPEISGFGGTVSILGYPGVLSAELSFTGPDGATNVTSVSAPDGTFAVALAPGNYTLYAEATGASGLYANISEVRVGPAPTTSTTVFLGPAWTDTVTMVAPPGAVGTTGDLELVTSNDLILGFDHLTLGTPTVLVLPADSYTLKGNTSGSPYGAPANASATTTASLFSGNAASNLPLSWQFKRTVAIHLPITSVTVGTSGNFSVPFTVTNTGNRPFSVRFVGSPVTFNFTFSPANASLGLSVSNDSVTGSVRIVIPEGTAVAHAPLALEALVVGANGTVAGFASPTLSVNLTASYGLLVGAGTRASASTGPYNVTVPFFVRDTGNVPEALNFSILDAGRLAGLGWSTYFTSAGHRVVAAPNVAAGSNTSFNLVLQAPTGQALPPGSVQLVVTVLNGTGGLRASTELPVVTTNVGFPSPGLSTIGPDIGTPPAYPDWVYYVLCFVPAAAFAVVAVSYRWYRTRRWVRR